MSEAGEQRTIGLKVTNFGPIVEADIELRPLTVFVGPSNTGKSYLAILIYALHSLFAGYLAPSGRLLSRRRKRGIAAESTDRLLGWLEDLPDELGPDSLSNIPPLPADVTDRVRKVIRDRDNLGSALEAEIARCFGVGADVTQLIKVGGDAGVQITVGRNHVGGGSAVPSIEHEFVMRGENQSCEFKTSVPPGVDLQLSTSASTLTFASTARRMQRFEKIQEPETSAGNALGGHPNHSTRRLGNGTVGRAVKSSSPLSAGRPDGRDARSSCRGWSGD